MQMVMPIKFYTVYRNCDGHLRDVKTDHINEFGVKTLASVSPKSPAWQIAKTLPPEIKRFSLDPH